MIIHENFSLKNYNTFGIDATAKYFVEINSLKELRSIIGNNDYPRKIVIGGGSNMLLTDNIDALFIHINLINWIKPIIDFINKLYTYQFKR